MTIREAWQAASNKLTSHGFEDAQLEAELLLRQVLNVERDGFYSGLGGTLNNSQLNELNGLLEQRLGHRPSAYIRHSREFYGLKFYVDERVLVPRPETELLVDKALEVAREYAAFRVHPPTPSPLPSESLRLTERGSGAGYRNAQVLIADVGTGSGAIAIALAVHLPDARIYAADISPQALEVARLNCQKHGVTDRIELLQGDLLAPLPQPVDIIVANLPYVPDKDFAELAPEVSKHEPRIALSGGPDGLDYIRRLINQAPAKLKREGRFDPDASGRGALLLEVGIGQARAVAGLMRKHFSSVEIATDLAGVERVVVGRIRSASSPR
ncbi:MAG: peptide chain release factor N(5)-glutamine methyltransferase [Chloroflexi bacterium]|nr:peptide chain release factor N(5)-glutamine methyltransferase [Chloroflexota bacterium]